MIEILQTSEFKLSAIAFILLILYHLYIIYKTRHDPMATAVGLANHVRKLWLKRVIADDKDILAVQTLRNWTMASTFLASTAILIGLGIFNLALTADKQGELSLLIGLYASHHPSLWTGKLLLLGCNFLIAFFNFTLAIRYFNHSVFMINLPDDEATNVASQSVINTLNRGGLHYTYGMRGYYLSMPLALWLFGPIWFLSGTIILIVALYHLDGAI